MNERGRQRLVPAREEGSKGGSEGARSQKGRRRQGGFLTKIGRKPPGSELSSERGSELSSERASKGTSQQARAAWAAGVMGGPREGLSEEGIDRGR